jgi:uncharacterized protein (TIGR00159 family)
MILAPFPILSNLLDIALVACLIYGLLVWVKRTQTAFVAMGLILFGFIYITARFLDLVMTVWIFRGFFTVFIIAIIVIFQEEIRQVFERIAIWSFRSPSPPPKSPQYLEMIARAISDCAQDKIGALIVLQGRDPLGRHVHGGWDLDGEISEALLESIFDAHSLGHDGAVIIENGRVSRFGCRLPLSKRSLAGNLGTRHLAAIGLSELTDALSLIVSEEKGNISIAQAGAIIPITDLGHLQQKLEIFASEKSLLSGAPAEEQSFWNHNLREKLAAVAVSAFLWVSFVFVGR